MPLGSLTRWQSVLFCLGGFFDTCFQTDIPMIVVFTTLINLLFLFQFEYTDGSVIAAVAILETPTPMEDENPQEVAFSEVGKIEDPPKGQTGRTTRDESEGVRQFLWSLRQNFVRELIPTLCGSFLGLVGLHLLSLAGFLDNDLNHIVTGALLCGTIITLSKIFAIPTSSNAVTNQRSLARRYLHNQKGVSPMFTGLDVFMVYMFLTVLITVLAKSNSAEGAIFPVFVISRLFLGLTLTNLHTAWVHAVISMPTKKSIWQRIPGWREWLEILPVASLDIVLPNCINYLARVLLVSFRGMFFAALSNQARDKIPSTLATLGNIAFLTIPIVSQYLASIFTGALYVRAAASILPDNDQSVVPFDRSFGVRAKNETHCLSILDAFSTIKVQNWYRYLKIGWEVFIYEIVWAGFFILLIALELYYWAPCTAVDLLVLLVPREF